MFRLMIMTVACGNVLMIMPFLILFSQNFDCSRILTFFSEFPLLSQIFNIFLRILTLFLRNLASFLTILIVLWDQNFFLISDFIFFFSGPTTLLCPNIRGKGTSWTEIYDLKRTFTKTKPKCKIFLENGLEMSWNIKLKYDA